MTVLAYTEWPLPTRLSASVIYGRGFTPGFPTLQCIIASWRNVKPLKYPDRAIVRAALSCPGLSIYRGNFFFHLFVDVKRGEKESKDTASIVLIFPLSVWWRKQGCVSLVVYRQRIVMEEEGRFGGERLSRSEMGG